MRRNTRQQILDATQRLIEKEGFSRLTTKDIAQKAGCAEGTLFKHFKSKDDLCLAVVLENAPKFRDMLSAQQAGSGSVQKNLQDIATAALAFSEKLIPLAAAVLADTNLLMRQRKILSASRGGPQEAFDLLAAYLSEEQELGRIHSQAEPLAVSALLLGACFHRAFLRQGMGRPVPQQKDREFAVSLVRALMCGLRQAKE